MKQPVQTVHVYQPDFDRQDIFALLKWPVHIVVCVIWAQIAQLSNQNEAAVWDTSSWTLVRCAAQVLDTILGYVTTVKFPKE